jgi:ATP-dependent Lhr-like helicase
MDVAGLVRLLADVEAARVVARAVDRLTPSPAAFALVTAKPPAFLDGGALMDRRTRGVDAGADASAGTRLHHLQQLAGLRHLGLEAETAVHPEAVARVAAEVAPDLRTRDDAAAHLALAGVLTDGEVDAVPVGRAWLAELEAAGRARRFRGAGGQPLWIAVERLDELSAAFPTLAAGAPPAAARLTADAALARVLAGRLETSGPVTAGDVAGALGVPEALARDALDRLVREGVVLCGAYDPRRPGAATWCERRVLARIERLTRNKLRAEIEPVTLQEFYRFLLRWQGLAPGDRRGGREGLAEVVGMLDGVELPAGAWEESVLAARVVGYDLDLLDELCLSGEIGWGRLTPPAASAGDGPDDAPDDAPRPAARRGARQGLTRATPIALYRTEHLDTWRALARDGAGDGRAGETAVLSAHAAALLAALDRRGASFLGPLERALTAPPVERRTRARTGAAVTRPGWRGRGASLGPGPPPAHAPRPRRARAARAGRRAGSSPPTASPGFAGCSRAPPSGACRAWRGWRRATPAGGRRSPARRRSPTRWPASARWSATRARCCGATASWCARSCNARARPAPGCAGPTCCACCDGSRRAARCAAATSCAAPAGSTSRSPRRCPSCARCAPAGRPGSWSRSRRPTRSTSPGRSRRAPACRAARPRAFFSPTPSHWPCRTGAASPSSATP